MDLWPWPLEAWWPRPHGNKASPDELLSRVEARLAEVKARCDAATPGPCDLPALIAWALEMAAEWRKKVTAAAGLWGLDEVLALESLARALGVDAPEGTGEEA